MANQLQEAKAASVDELVTRFRLHWACLAVVGILFSAFTFEELASAPREPSRRNTNLTKQLSLSTHEEHTSS